MKPSISVTDPNRQVWYRAYFAILAIFVCGVFIGIYFWPRSHAVKIKDAIVSESKPLSRTSEAMKVWPSNAPKLAIVPFDSAHAEQHQEEWANYLKLPVEYTNSIGMKFRLIPPGEFMMGSTVLQVILPSDGSCLIIKGRLRAIEVLCSRLPREAGPTGSLVAKSLRGLFSDRSISALEPSQDMILISKAMIADFAETDDMSIVNSVFDLIRSSSQSDGYFVA